MKTIIKMSGKYYDVVLHDCNKVIEKFNYKKDGTPCKMSKERIWKNDIVKDINDVVEYLKNNGFSIEVNA